MTNGHYICNVKRKIHREDIINTGLQLMFLNGYNATGIKEITDSIAIPKGSFYNHFQNKEEFGLEVLQHYCDNGLRMYRNVLLDDSLSPLERLNIFFDRIISTYEEETNFKRLHCLI